jgi:3-oxoacyl-(acyl-carrier-protein) synthase
MSLPPVVVTGMGVITTLGDDLETFYQALIAGRSGIGRMSGIDERVAAQVGGDLSSFSLDAYLERRGANLPPPTRELARKLVKRSPLSTRLNAACALQAFEDAGLFRTPVDHRRIGHVLGGHNLTTAYLMENLRTFDEEPEFIEPLLGLKSWDTDVLSVTSEVLGVRGPSFIVGAACASSNVSLLSALDLIRVGRADLVLVSGAPMEISSLLLQACVMMEAVSFRSFNDAPQRASRPFDARREGFVPSHGAAALVLEAQPHAERRGARPWARLLGASSASAASRHAKPSFDSQLAAISGALEDAGVAPGEVDYVNAHATSTPLGDAVEVAALKEALGRRAWEIPVNSTKSMVGHALTAASAVELVATILQLTHGRVHPTINQEEPDPELGLDFVPNVARDHRIRVALSNAFGFGGLNSSVVVGAP